MLHYYTTPATVDVAKYLIYGGRGFNAVPDSKGNLSIRFMATEAYVEKMRQRPFFKNIQIDIKA